MSVYEDKKQLRKVLKARRKALGEATRLTYSQMICRKILQDEAYLRAKKIFVFAPMSTEVRIDLFFSEADQTGKALCFPATFEEGRMEAYLPEAWNRMNIDPMGFRTPDPKKDELIDPDDLDLVLVPLLGFDAELFRIGYGGGFYDRYLSRLSPHTAILGVAFDVQKVERIPRNRYDVALPRLVTEKTLYTQPD